ncbi:hypothetical protein CRM22_009815 [Opisthorchis felineus]|uniref:polynucleotide adenylyltransferase n=1 Tax=Opisthorchis felineus TaxID=147828 RepID=A0A4S2L501_OPIFE|nr:hypothetical protein CRM22_009815 [Opisthorchis felineus]
MIDEEVAKHLDLCLMEVVESFKLFDSTDERRKKLNIVRSLEHIGEQWVRELASDQRLTHRLSDKTGLCRLLVQGSTALGISSRSGDIDAVLLVPNFVDRDDFFSSFPSWLRKSGDISELAAVPDTFVPLIRIKVSGIQVDLVISRLATSYIPRRLDFEQTPGDLYRNMDAISVRSLSGLHLAYELKKMMLGHAHFLPMLRVIRTWVRARAIGSYVYGFPPSIAWTIMVVYICRRLGDNSQISTFCVCRRSSVCRTSEPAAERNSGKELLAPSSHGLSCLVYTFFAQFASWPWPHPVQIASIKVASDLNIFSWDPQRNAQDGRDLMPILTPVFPNKNAAFTVRQATRKIVTDELIRARDIVSDVLRGSGTWEKLFERYDLRDHHRHFLLLTLQTTSKEELVVVGGLVDSRLRDLAQALEDEQHIRSARIAPTQERILVFTWHD